MEKHIPLHTLPEARTRTVCPFSSLIPKRVLNPNLHTPRLQSETESTSLQLKALARHAEVKGWVERIQALGCFIARLCGFSVIIGNQELSSVGMEFALPIGSISGVWTLYAVSLCKSNSEGGSTIKGRASPHTQSIVSHIHFFDVTALAGPQMLELLEHGSPLSKVSPIFLGQSDILCLELFSILG